MRGTFAILLGVLVGCQSHTASRIDWEPVDPALVHELREAMHDYNAEVPLRDQITVQEMIDFDPLSVVDNSRFTEAFPQILPGDQRIAHCQLESTGSNSATVAFTPSPTSTTTARLNFFRCKNDYEEKHSTCEPVAETGYHINDPDHVFRIGERIDTQSGLQVMRLLAQGKFRSEVERFPPPEWPSGWWSQHVGRYLGAPWDEPSSNQFVLSFEGCACRPQATIRYDPDAMPNEVVFVDFSVLCI